MYTEPMQTPRSDNIILMEGRIQYIHSLWAQDYRSTCKDNVKTVQISLQHPNFVFMITLQWDMIPPVAMDNKLTVAGLAFHYLAFIVKCLANGYS